MAGIVKPKALAAGDSVAVIAPSEPISKEELVEIERFFQKHNYFLRTGENILKSVGDYIAGMPIERAQDFNWAFSEPDIKAVFTAVGGYGASQVLDRIDFAKVAKNPRIFAGYSDATTLQLAIFSQTGLVTFHGPNATRLPEIKEHGYTLKNFWKVLTNTTGKISLESQSAWQEIVSGSAEGVLFGGNISCLCRLLGTPWDPIVALPKIFGKDTKYLFFWEEVADQFSDILRNLWQIRNTGFFEQVSGMIVGKLTSVAEKDYENFPPKKALIAEATERFGFPILYGVDFGHEVPQMTIPIGVKALMDTKTRKLEILEPAVT